MRIRGFPRRPVGEGFSDRTTRLDMAVALSTRARSLPAHFPSKPLGRAPPARHFRDVAAFPCTRRGLVAEADPGLLLRGGVIERNLDLQVVPGRHGSRAGVPAGGCT